MTINVVVMPSDSEFVDLAIFDGVRLCVFDLPDGKKVVVLMGFFVDSDLQYPVAFCKSFDDGKQILVAVQKAMMIHQRIVDITQCTFQPDASMLAALQASAPEERQPIDRDKRTVPEKEVIMKGRVKDVVAESAVKS